MDIVKKYEELVKKVQEVVPGASFDRDNEGQIIIYTNLEKDFQGNLYEWSASDWDESSC